MTRSEQLISYGVYLEKSFDGKWCFKHQPKGCEIIMRSGEDKEKTADRFFIDYIKGIHYELRHLFQSKDVDALKSQAEKYLSYNDVSITKTVEIITTMINEKHWG